LQFALRGLPAQITDIGVSLASGQRPLMVLLQQGGQLKDMFGGIVPAAKALGSSLLALINPYTLTAAAIVAIGAAWNSAENDAAAFNKALIVTGNYAGKTATQLEAMVGSIATTANASSGSAREALQKVAETGRFTGEQFNLVAIAAARMESATGQSIDDTIKKFEDLGKSPVDALLKLNDTEHFLTQAQLDRVRALQKEGKEQEAAAEAARIYAGRLDEVADAAEAARPHLSKMWKEAKDGASAAWEETKNFVEFLAAASEKAQKIPWYQRMSAVGGLRAGIAGLYGAEPTPPTTVKPVAGAVDSDQEKGRQKFLEETDRHLDKQHKLWLDIAKAKADGLKYDISQAEVAKRIVALTKEYTDSLPMGSKRKKVDPEANAYKTFSGQVDALNVKAITAATPALEKYEQGIARLGDQLNVYMSKSGDATKAAALFLTGQKALQAELDRDNKARADAITAYRSAIDQQIAARQDEIDLQVQSIGMGAKEAQQLMEVARIRANVASKIEQLNRQRSQKGADTDYIDQEIAAQQASIPVLVAQEREKWERIGKAQADGLNGMKAAIADFMEE
jgi:phage-related minor tail protein